MKDLPVLFSGPMVRAILEGRKTQTRRVVKPQPVFRHGAFELIHKGQEVALLPDAFVEACSTYQPGCHLWVKETFLNNALAGYDPVYFYRADDPEKPSDRHWKPSIFMPRAASRITLGIISVRVERVQDITAADAIAEGIGVDDGQMRETPNFRELWDSINAKRSNGIYAWSNNPWVWRIEFPPFSRSLNQGADA